MKNVAELNNRIAYLEYCLASICHLFALWVNQTITVVYKSSCTTEELRNKNIPLGMMLAMIYTTAYEALGEPLPKVGSWEEMFPLGWPTILKEPEECDTLMTIFKSLERRSPQDEAS